MPKCLSPFLHRKGNVCCLFHHFVKLNCVITSAGSNDKCRLLLNSQIMVLLLDAPCAMTTLRVGTITKKLQSNQILVFRDFGVGMLWKVIWKSLLCTSGLRVLAYSTDKWSSDSFQKSSCVKTRGLYNKWAYTYAYTKMIWDFLGFGRLHIKYCPTTQVFAFFLLIYTQLKFTHLCVKARVDINQWFKKKN